jgi:hypothetical protein
VVDDARGQRLEERKELVPNARAEEARVHVGRVGGVGELVSVEVCLDVALAGANERADEVSVTWRQDGEAGGAPSAK